MAAAQGAGAVELHGAVDDVLRGLRGEELRHRRAQRDVGGARVVRRRRPVDHEAGGVGAQGHLGDVVGDGLEAGEGAAERLAAGGVREGRVEGGLRHADRERAHAGPEEVEGAHGDPEPAVGLAEDVGVGDGDAVEAEGADRVRGEHVERGAGEAGAVGGEQERGHAAGARAGGGAGEEGVEVRLGGVGDPALLTGEPPAAGAGAVRLGRQGEGGRVGARAGLAEREGGHRRALAHRGQPAGALLFRAVGVHGVGAQPLEGEGRLGLRAGVGEGFAHQAQVEGAGGEQPGQEPEPAEFGDEGTVDPAGLPLVGEGAQVLGREGAELRASGDLFRFE